jgi:cytochrome c-type biogenesis protein
MTGALSLAAAGAGTGGTTILAAFAVGFISFISPCVLPLVPGYLSAVSGVSLTDMRTKDRDVSAILGPAIIFCLSFTVMFVALGMTATGLGSSLRDHIDTLNKVAGAFIVLMGIFFLATPFIDRLNQEWRPEALMAKAGSGGPIIAGLAFAVAWTPCVGPTLTSILAAAATTDTVGKGGILLAFYSAGLAVPFLLTAVAFDRMTTAFGWIRAHYAVVTAVSGLILIGMGTLMLTGELTQLNIQAQRALNSIGLDIFNR